MKPFNEMKTLVKLFKFLGTFHFILKSSFLQSPNIPFDYSLRLVLFKGAYSVRNSEKNIFSIILYIKAEHLENVVSKFQDDWRKIDRGRAF